MKLESGMVALVGAGPGDVGLITVRGAEWLRAADVVVYDALSNPKLLRHAPTAKHIYVGKRAAEHAKTQDEINALLVSEAKAGKKVVRLKGGDPFVFGRGGEECEVLANNGIKYLIAPGVTAAVAATAYAGIPITHRDLNSSFTLLTGHEKEEAYKDDAAKARGAAVGSSDVDWASIAKLPCVAFYMGIKSLPRISAKLIENGLPPETPTATIQWGTLPRQRTVSATIATIADAVKSAGIGSPAITVVGKVVALRDTLKWFENRPLFGQTIVVTRTRDQASALSEQLEDLGADVIEAATIETVPSADTAAVDTALRSFSEPAKAVKVAPPPIMAGSRQIGPRPTAAASHPATQWLIFTSASGVTAAKARMKAIGLDARSLANVNIAVVGDATAETVRKELAIEPDFIPQRFTAEALADELIAAGKVKDARFVLLRADIARPILVEKLKTAGAASVEDITVYETRTVSSLPEELTAALAAKKIDWITFTSSSTAKNLCTLLGSDFATQLAGVKLASIGPVTTAALKELGLSPTVEAAQADVGALADALRSYSK
jgi:uroporphyrinogen III methyltransferase / synthase